MELPSPLPPSLRCAFATVPDAPDWEAIQRRFPERRLAELSEHRRREHAAVDAALGRLGVHESVTHGPSGRPQLGSGHLSISHARDTEGAVWAAAVIAPGPIGIDLETIRPQLARIEPRIFSEFERAAVAASAEPDEARCAIWNVKEAAWKALGPDLDYLGGIEVLDPLNVHGLAHGRPISVRVLTTIHRFYVARLTNGLGVAIGPL